VLRWRTATALVLAPVAFGAIVLGKWAVLLVVLLVTVGSAYELSQALNPLPFLAALGAGVIPILLSIPYGTTGILVGALLALPWALLWLAGRQETRTLRSVLAVVLMSLWVGVPLAHLCLFPRSAYGVILILIAVVGPWISDSGAFFAGRSLGGLLATVLGIGFVSYQFVDFTLGKAAVIGAGVSIFSQTGDLFESALKRILDMKDLGHFLPGHGGILDRVDSLLFTAPAVYYISLLV
jgi:phosphatidate cytidylyltransferase